MRPTQATALMQALQKEFDDQLATNTGSETRATQRVDVATASVASLRESSRQKNAQLRRNEERLTGISSQLKEVRVSERAVQEAQQLMDSTEAQLQKKRADVNASPLSAEVAQLAQSIDRMKAEVAALRRDRDELSSAAGEAAKITVLRNDAKDKDDAAQKLYEERKSSLDVLFGDQQVCSGIAHAHWARPTHASPLCACAGACTKGHICVFVHSHGRLEQERRCAGGGCAQAAQHLRCSRWPPVGCERSGAAPEGATRS
jgi:seryl-tRNA synthetase